MCRSFNHAGYATQWRPPRPRATADPVSTPDDLRVSDAERDAVIARLRRHVSDGRLTLDEFEGRVEEATRARTGRELRAVLRELPPVDLAPAPAPSRPSTGLRFPGWAMPVAILVVLSVAIGHFVIWPLFFFAFCGFGRWHRHESAEADDQRTPIDA